MVSSNIRDLLTAFSPSLDYFAISSGDGRIKVPGLLILILLMLGEVLKELILVLIFLAQMSLANSTLILFSIGH